MEAPAVIYIHFNTSRMGSARWISTVGSWQGKQLCGQVAKGIKGVRGLQNNITVSYFKVNNNPFSHT